MSVSEVVRANVDVLGNAPTTYQTNVAEVAGYATSVVNSKLPVLTRNPPDWDAYVTAHTAAETAALEWFNSVFAELQSIPVVLQQQSKAFETLFQDAIANATTLVTNPGDTNAKEFLEGQIERAERELEANKDLVSTLIDKVTKFNDSMPQQAAALLQIATRAKADAQVDEAEVNSLQKAVTEAEQEISRLTAALVALGVADGVAITLGVVAVAAAGPFGFVTWIVLGPIVAVATTFIVLDSIKLVGAKAQVETLTRKMSELTKDAAQLNVNANVYKQLNEAAERVKSNLTAILAAWGQIAAELKAVKADIEKASSDTTSALWQGVIADFRAAQADWSTLMRSDSGLVLPARGNSAALRLGMSGSEVGAAVTATTDVDFIRWINAAA